MLIQLNDRHRQQAIHGTTLTELLITSGIALIMIIGVTRIDVARIGIEQDIHRNSVAGQPDRFGAALASYQLAESLSNSDVAVITPGGGGQPDTIQIRKSTCTGADRTCFNTPDNYIWEQYSVDTMTTPWRIVYYSNAYQQACSIRRELAGEITGLKFRFVDAEPTPPPGGDPSFVSPPGADNNMVSYELTWSDGVNTQVFPGQVFLRDRGYTDVPEGGLTDVRFGEVSPVPPICSGPAVPPSPTPPPRPCGHGVPGQNLNPLWSGMGAFIKVIDGEQATVCFDNPGGVVHWEAISYSKAQCESFGRVSITTPNGTHQDVCMGGINCTTTFNGETEPGTYYVDIVGGTPNPPCGQNVFVGFFNFGTYY